MGESSFAGLPPPININQLDYAEGRKAVDMREDDYPWNVEPRRG